MGRQVGERNVGRRIRRIKQAAGRLFDRRRDHDGRANGDVRLGATATGNSIPDLHAATQTVAILAEHVKRVLRQLLADAVRGVRLDGCRALGVGRPSAVGETRFCRLRPQPDRFLGDTVQRGQRPATVVRVVQDDILVVGHIRVAHKRRVHIHAADLPVQAQVRTADAHHWRRQSVWSGRVLCADVHTDRARHVPRELQPDRVHTVRGHARVGQPPVASEGHHHNGPGGPFRGADRSIDEKSQQSRGRSDRAQHRHIHAEGQPVQGYTSQGPDHGVRDWVAQKMETGRFAVATASKGQEKHQS